MTHSRGEESPDAMKAGFEHNHLVSAQRRGFMYTHCGTRVGMLRTILVTAARYSMGTPRVIIWEVDIGMLTGQINTPL